MNDLIGVVAWLAVLAGGLGGCLLLYRRGLHPTYVRDILHIGTGVWVLGWPLWHGWVAPMLIMVLVLLATVALPILARRNSWAALVMASMASGDEHWSGVSLYVLAYAVLTCIGLVTGAFAAGAALLSLSLGDGIGGAIGRRFGTHHYQMPGGKLKSIEGTLMVALAATVGVLIAAWRFDAHPGVTGALVLGVVAAIAEAISPRSSDNVVVPAVVWGAAMLLG